MTKSPDSYKEHLYILIYCGGGGTRLWPYSREKTPKQFLSFNGGETLIRKTFERVRSIVPLDHIYVITLPDYTDEVRKFLHEIPSKQVIVEPARRDTLLAAGLGAVVIKQKDPSAIIANIWSDQLIEGVEYYRNAILAGAKTAWEQKALVTSGVRPEYAHPGLEYVKRGEHYDEIFGTNVYKVDQFIERPERSGKDVEAIAGDKKTMWHVATWVWEVNVFLEKIKKHSPETYKRLALMEEDLKDSKAGKKMEKIYADSPKVQIDMVISKDEDEMFVVEGEYDWLDLGDFNVLWKMLKKDTKHNTSLLKEDSEWINIDTEGSFVLSKGKKLIATIGLKDIVVVALGDAVLVMPRGEAQKVKQLVNKLKEENRQEYL